MRSYITLISALVVALLVVEQVDAGYKAINRYLATKLDDYEPGPNMKAAVEWLGWLEGNWRSRVMIGTMMDLKKFTSLQRLMEDPKCDREEFEIMRANHAKAELYWVRHIDQVMRKIFLEHAKKCFRVYPSVFKAKQEQFNDTIFEDVRAIGALIIETDKLIGDRRDDEFENCFYDLEHIISYYVLDGFRITREKYGYFLRNLIKAKAGGEADFMDKKAQKLTKESTKKIKDLVDKVLVEPCSKYVDAFGRDLFLIADFEEQYNEAEPEEDDVEFYYGWTYFNICRSLIEKKSAVIKDIIASVAEQ